MTIFMNNIKRILKDKVALVFMIVLPVILIAVICSFNSNGGSLNVGIVDKDNTEFTKIVRENLASQNRVKVFDIEEKEIKQSLIDVKVDYVIEMENGFTNNIIAGENVKIKGYSISGKNIHLPVKLYLDNFINIARNIGKASSKIENSSDKFYEGIKYYSEGKLGLTQSKVDASFKDNSRLLQALGFLVMGVFSLATFGYSFTVEDKENKIYYRLFTTPLTLKRYMFENILSVFVISLVQILMLLGFLQWVLKMDIGKYFVNMFIVLSVFSIVSVALGMFINSISKSTRQAGVIGTLIFSPFCMLGGCFWPREIMPDILKQISNFVPTTWILKALEKVVYGDSLSSLGMEMGILLLFALVFFFLSSWKVSDISA